jgi:alpha-galactosidase
MYRLLSPYENGLAAWQYVSEDRETVMLFTYIISGKPGINTKRVCLQGIDPDSYYEDVDTKCRYKGDFLMNFGVARRRNADYLSFVSVYRKI